jgi:hypothetical protein
VFVDSMPSVRLAHELQHQGRMESMQRIAAEECRAQQEEHSAQCDSSGTWEAGTQVVTYQGLESRGTLTLPTAKCCGCRTLVGAPSPQHALQLGCFASTPVFPAVYYDQRVMALYRRLGLVSGLSTSGAYALLPHTRTHTHTHTHTQHTHTLHSTTQLTRTHTDTQLTHALSISCCAAGFVDALWRVQQDEECEREAAIKADSFLASFCAYLATACHVESLSFLDSCGIEGMEPNPLADCPICTIGPGESERATAAAQMAATVAAAVGATGVAAAGQAGAAGPDAAAHQAGVDTIAVAVAREVAAVWTGNVSVMVDAVVKPSHLSSAGSVTRAIPGFAKCYFTEADAEVHELHKAGKLNLKSYFQAEPDEDLDEEELSCTTSLHCSRPEAKSRPGRFDIWGLVGGCCSHNFPLRGCFMDMRSPEKFVYYLIFLLHLATATAGAVKHVYIDFACRLGKTWERFLRARVGTFTSGVLAVCQNIVTLVNWMHGASHNRECQLKCGGRYHTGAGRKVGENAEQLWSMVKVCT